MSEKQEAKELKTSLNSVLHACEDRFGKSNPARVEQLRDVLITATMTVDHLFTETPYTSL